MKKKGGDATPQLTKPMTKGLESMNVKRGVPESPAQAS
jgi:hypothetical protein